MPEITRNGYIAITGTAVAITLAGLWYYLSRKTAPKPPAGDNLPPTGCQSYLDCPMGQQCVNGVCVEPPLFHYTETRIPNAPTALTAVFNVDTSIRLNWNAPANNGANIIGYRVYRVLDYGYAKETEAYGVPSMPNSIPTTWVDTQRKGKIGQPANSITYQVTAIARDTQSFSEEPKLLESAKSNTATVVIPTNSKSAVVDGVFINVSLHVKDVQPVKYIQGAVVTVDGKSATTDKNGAVSFKGLARKSTPYIVTITYNGKTTTKSVSISPAEGGIGLNLGIDTNTPNTPNLSDASSFNPFASTLIPGWGTP